LKVNVQCFPPEGAANYLFDTMACVIARCPLFFYTVFGETKEDARGMSQPS
jgi:hypothetical protein